MVTVKELRDWLKDFPEDELIGIDEGGLTLQCVQTDAWYEIGGLPE